MIVGERIFASIQGAFKAILFFYAVFLFALFVNWLFDAETWKGAQDTAEDFAYQYREIVGYCDNLREDLQHDQQCMGSDNCVMTRDELVDYEERVEKLAKYCKAKLSPD